MRKEAATLIAVSDDGGSLELYDGRKLKVAAIGGLVTRGWVPIDELELTEQRDGAVRVWNVEDQVEVSATWEIR